jgi:hypothetical protein
MFNRNKEYMLEMDNKNFQKEDYSFINELNYSSSQFTRFKTSSEKLKNLISVLSERKVDFVIKELNDTDID